MHRIAVQGRKVLKKQIEHGGAPFRGAALLSVHDDAVQPGQADAVWPITEQHVQCIRRFVDTQIRWGTELLIVTTRLAQAPPLRAG